MFFLPGNLPFVLLGILLIASVTLLFVFRKMLTCILRIYVKPSMNRKNNFV